MLGTKRTYTGAVPRRSSKRTVVPSIVATEKTGRPSIVEIDVVGVGSVVGVGVAGSAVGVTSSVPEHAAASTTSDIVIIKSQNLRTFNIRVYWSDLRDSLQVHSKIG